MAPRVRRNNWGAKWVEYLIRGDENLRELGSMTKTRHGHGRKKKKNPRSCLVSWQRGTQTHCFGCISAQNDSPNTSWGLQFSTGSRDRVRAPCTGVQRQDVVHANTFNLLRIPFFPVICEGSIVRTYRPTPYRGRTISLRDVVVL